MEWFFTPSLYLLILGTLRIAVSREKEFIFGLTAATEVNSKIICSLEKEP
jgi:hypothetical protein